jgi:glycerophosphoryl diester phosphodiesterase
VGAESITYRRRPAARSLRTELILELKNHHVPIMVYTVNHRGRDSLAVHLAELGIDGVFTDDPAGLRRYVDRSEAEVHRGPR